MSTLDADAPAPFLLHACAEQGCRRPALAVRCHEHMTDDDRRALDELHVAVIAASDAEERWRDARLRVREAERTAGVRRNRPDAAK
jgi:hypothetical protein